jgi:hypothetical protein
MREMSAKRRLAVVVLTLVVLAFLWVAWSRPTKTDMAAYVPADSLAYLEANSLADAVASIRTTEAWRTLAPIFHLSDNPTSPWFVTLARWTGIGPTNLVVSSRAQVAIAVMNIGTFEESGNLKVKPEFTIIIETHTSSLRTRSLTESSLSRLAVATYGKPDFRRTERNGVEFLIWQAPAEPRQIVAVVDGTVVYVGNSEETIEACLAVRRGARPSLSSNVELQDMRRKLDNEHAIAFGFVSSENAARLTSIAAPLLIGSSDAGFQKILPAVAGKILGSIGWASRGVQGSIEDRYMFKLSKPVITRLQTGFQTTSREDQFAENLLAVVESGTQYRFQDPMAGWQSFDSAMLSQLDAVSAVVFKALMKSSLTTYGIEDAEQFLRLIQSQVITLRVTERSPRSTILVNVPSVEAQRLVIGMSLGTNARPSLLNDGEIYEASGKDHVIGIKGGYLLIGPLEDVRTCLGLLTQNAGKRRIPTATVGTAIVRSYSDDSQRIKNFFLAVATAQGQMSEGAEAVLEVESKKLPLSITESSVTGDGIERRTRSPLGQLGTLAALVFSQ